MSDYILLKGNEDGNPIRIIHSIHHLLDAPEDWGITKFENGAFLGANPDPNYWPDGTGVLLKVEAVVPEPVTAKWRLPTTLTWKVPPSD